MKPPLRQFAIASFNLWNLLAPDQEGGLEAAIARAALAVHLTKISLTIQHLLGLPAIICVQEVGDEALLESLASEINKATGAGYCAVAPPVSDRRGIRVGILWDRRQATLLDASQLSGPEVDAAFGPDSPNAGREPLHGHFHIEGSRLSLLVNHFKSNYVPETALERVDERRLISQRQRLAQATVVRAHVDALLATEPGAFVAVVGDFNAGSEPGGPLPILIGSRHDRRLVDLWQLAGESHPYTYVGQLGPVVLDYILASPALAARARSFHVYHVNATADPSLASDPATPARASDHDPIMARFLLP